MAALKHLPELSDVHDRMDRVDRARLMESCGARDDSPSWNRGRVKQGDTIREGGTSPRGQGAEGREGVRTESEVFRVQQAQGEAADRECGRMHDREERREREKDPGNDVRVQPDRRRGVVDWKTPLC